MDKETEKQALEAFDLATKNRDMNPYPFVDCSQKIWLAAWEARGRANKQTGADVEKLEKTFPNEHAQDAAEADIPTPLFEGELRIMGIGRVSDDTNPYAKTTLAIYCNHEPTDDELRHIHDLLCGRASGQQGVEVSSAELGQLLDNYGRSFHNAKVNYHPLNIQKADFDRQALCEWIRALAASPQITTPAAQPSDSVQGWQPIETAPKDGNKFLTYNANQGGVVWVAWWSGVRQYFVGSGDKGLFQFTHWMPLPPEPPGGT